MGLHPRLPCCSYPLVLPVAKIQEARARTPRIVGRVQFEQYRIDGLSVSELRVLFLRPRRGTRPKRGHSKKKKRNKSTRFASTGACKTRASNCEISGRARDFLCFLISFLLARAFCAAPRSGEHEKDDSVPTGVGGSHN